MLEPFVSGMFAGGCIVASLALGVCAIRLITRSRRGQPATPTALSAELADIAKELRTMSNPRIQALADRLDAAAVKAREIHADDEAAENTDLDTLETHMSGVEGSLGITAADAGSGEQPQV